MYVEDNEVTRGAMKVVRFVIGLMQCLFWIYALAFLQMTCGRV